MTDDDGVDQIFLIGGPQSSQGLCFIYPSLPVKLESFLNDLFLYFIWTTSLKFTSITFLRSPVKLRKIYNRITCLSAFQKWATCQNRLKSTELGSNATIEKTCLREKQRVRFHANQCYRQTLKYPKYWNSAGTEGNNWLL